MDKKQSPEHKPGDLIINKYMPDATPEQKEEARENLRAFARLIVRVETRLAREAWEAKQKELENVPAPESSNPAKSLTNDQLDLGL